MKAPLNYILALLIALPFMALSQKAPGYLGKKFTIEYNGFLFPSFYNPNSPDAEPIDADEDLRQKGVSLNYQHKFMGQWSFSKRSSLVTSVGFVNTNFLPGKYPYGNFSGNSIMFEKYPDMSATSFDAGIRIFTQHYSPLGKFIEFKLGFATVKTESFDYSVIDAFGTGDTFNYTVEGGSMTWPTIGMGFGTSRIIKDIIIISYGMDLSFYSGGLGNYIGLAGEALFSDFRDEGEGNTENNQEALLKMAGARYALHSMVNLRIGIGILL